MKDGAKALPRKGGTHGEHRHSAWCHASSAGVCALTCTLSSLMAPFIQISKGHEKPNNSKTLVVISDPQISKQILILQMRRWGTCVQQLRAEPENPDFLCPFLITPSVNSCEPSGFSSPFSLQDIFTFPQWFATQGMDSQWTKQQWCTRSTYPF